MCAVLKKEEATEAIHAKNELRERVKVRILRSDVCALGLH